MHVLVFLPSNLGDQSNFDYGGRYKCIPVPPFEKKVAIDVKRKSKPPIGNPRLAFNHQARGNATSSLV